MHSKSIFCFLTTAEVRALRQQQGFAVQHVRCFAHTSSDRAEEIAIVSNDGRPSMTRHSPNANASGTTPSPRRERAARVTNELTALAQSTSQREAEQTKPNTASSTTTMSIKDAMQQSTQQNDKDPRFRKMDSTVQELPTRGRRRETQDTEQIASFKRLPRSAEKSEASHLHSSQKRSLVMETFKESLPQKIMNENSYFPGTSTLAGQNYSHVLLDRWRVAGNRDQATAYSTQTLSNKDIIRNMSKLLPKGSIERLVTGKHEGEEFLDGKDKFKQKTLNDVAQGVTFNSTYTAGDSTRFVNKVRSLLPATPITRKAPPVGRV